MKNFFLQKCFCLFVLSMSFISSAYAASTPPLSLVSAETAQNMAANATQTITYTIQNNVPAPVQINLAANRTQLTPASPLVTWQFTDNCQFNGMPHYVPPNGQCDVSVRITSGNNSGQVQQSAVINYGPTFQAIAPAPALNYTVGSGSGGALLFTAAPTGQSMLTNSIQDIVWTLSNTTGSAIALSGENFTVASSLIGAPTFSNDCNNSVPANGVCHIDASIQSLSNNGTVSQYLSVTYNGSAKVVVDTPTNFTVAGSSTGMRTFSFVNKCPYPVWFAFHGGSQITTTCTTDADCDTKSGVPGAFSCSSNQCFWKNPTPSNSNYALAALVGTSTVQLTEHVYAPTPSQPIVWSGVIGGRTGCTSGTCDTADCGGGGTGACNVGQGLNQPATQFESTLQANGDNFDVEDINGLNVPMSVEPVNATPDSFNPYTCGSSGVTNNQAANGGTIGGCSWNYTPPSNAYIWVANAGSTVCTQNSDCNQAGGEACGLKQSSITGNLATTMCGKFLGYWTADQVCGINSNYSQAPFTCNAAADGGATFSNMYQCNAGVYSNSCYTTSGQTGCCGCQNWQESPANLLVPSNNSVVQQCAASGNHSSNTTWVNNALPTLIWYKSACPSMYVYPFDDKTSSFTCSNATPNHVNYRVTFCPAGLTGAPAKTVPIG